MKRWRFKPTILVLALVLIVALSNCGKSNQANRPAGALVYGSSGDPVNLEPGNITEGNSLIIQEQIYDRLLSFKSGTTELEPGLATQWQATDSGKIWTFKLRRGVKFHDGTNFDAEAVKFNVERWWDSNNQFGYRSAGKTYEIWRSLFGGYKGSPDSLLQDVVTSGDTIKFVLKQPFAAFPAAIGSSYFGIGSPSAIKKAQEKYGTPSSLAVGTGPFVFKEWRIGDRIVLTKNPNYWHQGFPKSEQLIIRFINDPSARLAQLRAGTLDLTVDLSPDQLPELQQDPNLEAVFRPSFNVGYLALNPSYEPLKKIEVRQAIATAINKQEIVKAFWGKLGNSDPHFLPPSFKEFEAGSLNEYKYDPNKAKQLLAQAGYPNGFDLQMWYMPVSRPYYPTPKLIAEAFAADLNAVGIKVSLRSKDWTAYLADRNKPPGYQAFMMGWTGDYGDPDNFLSPHFGPGSTADIGNWKDNQMFQLLAQGRSNSNQIERSKIYQKIDDILNQQVLRLPIIHSQPLNAKRKNVNGWQPSPFGTEPLDSVSKA